MRRNPLLLLVGTAAALAVACRDGVVDPVRSPSAPSAFSSLSYSASGNSQNKSLLGTIELSPNGGVYHVGDFDIVVPAGAVCDPETTKYGVKHWDDDCTPATRSITVNAVAQRRGRGVSVQFQPDLRFRPSAGWVVIQTNAFRSLLTSDAIRQLSRTSPFFQGLAILYVPSGKQARIDEVRSTGDASMVTHVDLRTGLVWRRVKHFSGYLVTAGYNCPSPTADGGCAVDDPTAIVASPLDGSASSAIALFVPDSTVTLPSVVVDFSVVADSSAVADTSVVVVP